MPAPSPPAAANVAFPVQQVSLHGEEVAYRSGGHGPTVVLLHGIAGSSGTWIPTMAALTEHHSVLAPDFLGHGRSAKPAGDYSLGNQAAAVRDLLALVGVDRATIVGHSFGGGVAMQLAYQFPELCERLVLVDAGGLGREVSWLLRLAALPGAEWVMPLLFPAFSRPWGDATARLLASAGIRHPHAAEIWRSYRSLTDPGNLRAFTRTVRSVIDVGGQSVSALSRLYLAAAIPTLIVWGDQDRIIPVSHAHRAHDAIPGSRLEILPGVGHFPQVQQPRQLADLLADFIAGSEPATFKPEELKELLRQPR